ncbi:MAG: lipoyl(octanoyl) transferase LipB [Hyphomicrobium sp.]
MPSIGGINRQSPHRSKRLVAWTLSPEPIAYEAALAFMDARVRQIADGLTPELVWLLEHPPLYTAGTSAKPEDLLNSGGFPVYPSGRGGQFTYHGPGQRVAYVMLDVARRFGGDVRAFTSTLEAWLIGALADLGIPAFTVAGRTGVWVRLFQGENKGQEAKVAAIGLRIRRGISFHGVSLNVNPDLAHFGGIVPCGLAGSLVTSVAALGCPAPLKAVDIVLRRSFADRFAVRLIDAAMPTA